MGGAASLTQIPEELIERNAVYLGDQHLSAKLLHSRDKDPRDVLASLRRRSISDMIPGDKRRQSLSKRRASKSNALPRIAELPPSIVALLSKVGINDQVLISGGGTSTLVAHIFECLGALQHIIRSDQDGFAISSQNGEMEETQSMMDMNARSVGKLLHEIVTLYGLCGDTLHKLLDAEPLAASIEDSFGRLPLHVAVDREQPWMQTIKDLIRAYPEALNSRDGSGRLPLHIAVDRQEPFIDVVRYLVMSNKDTASARRGVGRLPIHYAVFAEHPSLEVIDCLLEAWPEGAMTTDVYGRLPLHYSVDKIEPQAAVIMRLLEAYPDGASVQDSHNRLVLSIAAELSSKLNYKVLAALYNAFPDAIRTAGHAGKLPLCSAVDQPFPNEACVHFLATCYPEAITQSSIPPHGTSAARKNDSPLELALNSKCWTAARMMLMVIPMHNPQMLRDLHWTARRDALLLVRQDDCFVETEAGDGRDNISISTSPQSSKSPSSTISRKMYPFDTFLVDAESEQKTVSECGSSQKEKDAPNAAAKDFVAPYVVQLSTQHLLLSAGLQSPAILSARMRERSNSISGRSEAESVLQSERGDPAPPVNLFRKLYVSNFDVFKVAVLYL